MRGESLTTAASSPTVCSTVNSLVLSVGMIHPKKEPPCNASGECAALGAKSGISSSYMRSRSVMANANHPPLSFVRPMYTKSHLVLRKQKTSTLVIPMNSDRYSWVENHGPSYQL